MHKLLFKILFICLFTHSAALLSCDDEDQNQMPEEGFCQPNTAQFPLRPDPLYESTLPMLHVDGTNIVDEDGNPVMLRGVNFGSWLLIESWIPGIGEVDEGSLIDIAFEKAEELGIDYEIRSMIAPLLVLFLTDQMTPWNMIQELRVITYEQISEDKISALDEFWEWLDSIPWIFDENSLWKYMTKQYGYDRMWELRNAYQTNYITELDLERVAELGLNLIRVPFWYKNLETDFIGNNSFVSQGWERLDELVNWARKHKVYIMLDMHGAPGGQSFAPHSGLENGGVLWENQDCIDKTARLWQAIANYFADEPHIVIYDLLNEPMSAPNSSAYETVHDTIYTSIREVDTNHIVMIEDGYNGIGMVVSPAEMGWENAMFSIHLYPDAGNASSYAEKVEDELIDLSASYTRFNCPLFLGEFSAISDGGYEEWPAQGMTQTFSMLNQRGIHWAPWTWKFYNDSNIWGLFHPENNPGTRIIVKDADFNDLYNSFISLKSINFHTNPDYEQAFIDNALSDYNSLNLEP